MVIIVLLLFISSCAPVNTIKIDIAAKPDLDLKESSYVEKKLGESGYYYLLLNYKLVDDPSLLNRLRRLGTRLSLYAERPEVEFKYVVIDSKYNRAFSMPDGYIVFSNAMINSLKTDENIQSVISHELAHISHRHGVYFYKEKYGAANVQNVSGERVISLSAQLGYQRAFELQADLMGMRYLQRSGLDPEQYVKTLELLDALQAKDDEELKKDVESGFANKNALKKDPVLELTYPDVANRIVHCRQKLQEVKDTEKVLYKPEDFQF